MAFTVRSFRAFLEIDGLKYETASASAAKWSKSHGNMSFLSEVIQGFYHANSAWTKYSRTTGRISLSTRQYIPQTIEYM